MLRIMDPVRVIVMMFLCRYSWRVNRSDTFNQGCRCGIDAHTLGMTTVLEFVTFAITAKYNGEAFVQFQYRYRYHLPWTKRKPPELSRTPCPPSL